MSGDSSGWLKSVVIRPAITTPRVLRGPNLSGNPELMDPTGTVG
jgi:hypothetical protein